MKNHILFLSLLILSISFCNGQDTIIFNNGTKKVVTITFIDSRVNYTDLNGKAYSASSSSINYIHYSSGEILTMSRSDYHHADTIHKKWSFSFDGGFSFPYITNQTNYYYYSVPSFWFLKEYISNSGWCLNANFEYKLLPSLRVIANYGFNQTNVVNYPTYISIANPYFSISQYMAGFELSPQTNISVRPFLKVLAGLITANYPNYTDQNYTGYYVQPNQYRDVVNAGSGTGFGFSIGGGLSCALAQILNLDLSFNYVTTAIHYPNWTITYYVNNAYSWTGNYSPTINFGIIQLTAGLHFNFLRKK